MENKLTKIQIKVINELIESRKTFGNILKSNNIDIVEFSRWQKQPLFYQILGTYQKMVQFQDNINGLKRLAFFKKRVKKICMSADGDLLIKLIGRYKELEEVEINVENFGTPEVLELPSHNIPDDKASEILGILADDN